MAQTMRHVAFAFALTLLSSTPTSSQKFMAHAKIPKVIWVTGKWSRDNKKELTQAFKNLQPALNFYDESAESDSAMTRAEGQQRAEQNFLNWAPPGTEVRYIDNAAMEDQVQNISQELEAKGVHGVSKAFHNLRAGSFRADLWRLLILWSRGGVYFDVNLIMNRKITDIIDFGYDKMVLVSDTGISPECRTHGAAFWNAVMASTAHNKYMLASIKAVVQNIEKHTYTWCDMTAMTGPTALGHAIATFNPDFRKDIRIEYAWVNPVVRKIGVNYSANFWEGVLCRKDEGLHYYDTDKHYTKLWNSRGIFCDEKGPPGALC